MIHFLPEEALALLVLAAHGGTALLAAKRAGRDRVSYGRVCNMLNDDDAEELLPLAETVTRTRAG